MEVISGGGAIVGLVAFVAAGLAYFIYVEYGN